MRRCLLLTLTLQLFVLTATAARAQENEVLYVRPWCELEPFIQSGSADYPLSREEASRKILEEGRILFSAMVYGYTFSYTPSDAARRIAESFALVPVAEIPWGSPRLEIRETAVENNRLYARLSYSLSDAEARRRAAWESGTVATSMGTGEGSLFKGTGEKITALDNAIKEAIRAYLRGRILNKPREVTGDVLLGDDPQTIVRAGVYRTTVKVRVDVRQVVPYRIF